MACMNPLVGKRTALTRHWERNETTMRPTETEAWLRQEMETMPVVDAHEHLPPERLLLAEHTDALLFFRQYTRLVMFSAGLEESAFLRMHDPDTPLDERFRIFESCRGLIEASAPARAAHIALKRFYGEDELTRANFDSITERMRALRLPGLYQRVLREACGIKAVLQNYEEMDYDDPLLRPVPMIGIGGEWGGFHDLAEKITRGKHGFNSIDEYIEERGERLRRLKLQGAVAFKTSSHPYCDPDRSAAKEVFRHLRKGDRSYARTDLPNPLLNYLTDRLLGIVGELGLPVAVHTGVWGDYRELDPKELIPHIMHHPEVRFDIFHMGLPFVRDTGRIGANFGNVWLNMCWAHTISPTMAINALDEWVDQVAANKIIAFGGDVRWCVEKVFGHLTLAREVVAAVLGRRIDRGLLKRDRALALARRWFLENPGELCGVL